MPLLCTSLGGNVSKRQRLSARRLHATLQPLVPLEHIVKGELYFIVLAEDVYEGEMRVGLARAEADGNKSSTEVPVRWYARKQWLSSKRKHSWGEKCGPTFEYARDPAKARTRKYVTNEGMSDFLPLRPQLTEKGKNDDEKPRLTGENVRHLRELCRQRGLLEEERAIGDEEESLDGEEEEEEEEEVEGESDGAGESESEEEAEGEGEAGEEGADEDEEGEAGEKRADEDEEGEAGEEGADEEEAVEGEGEAGEERAAEAVACELEREADEDVARNHSHRPQRARRRPPPLPPGSTHHQRGSAL